MRKLLLALELARVITDLLQCARMAIMGIIRMLVPRTATTVLTTLWVAYLPAPARGITAFMDVATTVAGTTVAASTVEATMAAAGSTGGAATIAPGIGARLIAAIAVASW